MYDDFASGLRAKRFAERLAERFGSECDLSESLWRSALLASPAVADEASRHASDSDFLILSLRGDHVPPSAVRQWVTSQLDAAAERGAALIVIWDAELGRRRVVGATRHYFRNACARRGVPFFSLVTTPPAEVASEDFFTEEAADLEAEDPERGLYCSSETQELHPS
jgi:hypothetical protein